MRTSRVLGPSASARVPIRRTLVAGWAVFDGIGGTNWTSANVSSTTDDGVGLYTITWREAFPTAGYALAGVIRNNAGDLGGWIAGRPGVALQATSCAVQTTRNITGSEGVTDVAEWTLVAIGA